MQRRLLVGLQCSQRGEKRRWTKALKYREMPSSSSEFWVFFEITLASPTSLLCLEWLYQPYLWMDRKAAWLEKLFSSWREIQSLENRHSDWARFDMRLKAVEEGSSSSTPSTTWSACLAVLEINPTYVCNCGIKSGKTTTTCVVLTSLVCCVWHCTYGRAVVICVWSVCFMSGITL